MSELKPCPFCGGGANMSSDNDGEFGKKYWQVWHECEGARFEGKRRAHYGDVLLPFFETPWYESKELAADAWNRRV